MIREKDAIQVEYRMSIKGSKGYCEYCRTKDEKNELSIDKKTHELICKECQTEINRYEELIATMEKRMTPTLEKYLIETCFERSRTNSHDERYKESILFVTKHKRSILRKLTKDRTKIYEKSSILPRNLTTSPTYFFGHSEVDLFVIQVQKDVASKNYTVSLIGRIELAELHEILR